MAATKTTKTKAPAKPKKASKSDAAGKKPLKASDKSNKLSALDAAAKVLGETGKAMSTKELIEAMAANGYWKSPGGKTRWSTLYAAIIKEIATKGKESRFKKTDRGNFART